MIRLTPTNPYKQKWINRVLHSFRKRQAEIVTWYETVYLSVQELRDFWSVSNMDVSDIYNAMVHANNAVDAPLSHLMNVIENKISYLHGLSLGNLLIYYNNDLST